MDPVAFGPFTFAPATGHLRRGSEQVPLQPQPARVLALLIARHGQVVTRDELRREIWNGTWVNFDQGLNYCIRQIRRALQDDARCPAYVQTLPQRGYRFVGLVSLFDDDAAGAADHRRAWGAFALAAALVAGLALGLGTARAVVIELGPAARGSTLASHLEPGHIVRGFWTHHVRPLVAGSPVNGARQPSGSR